MVLDSADRPSRSEVDFICPECRAALRSADNELRCANGHCFAFRDHVFNLLPGNPAPAVVHDAAYHAAAKDEWLELNQLLTERNAFYHGQIADYIAERCDARARILEIGGGVGFDLHLLMQRGLAFGHYVFSEISEDLCRFVANNIGDARITFVTLDAHHIPFPDNYFDVIYMVAALHHFAEVGSAFEELIRVCRPAGAIICGIEPNRRMMGLVKAGTSVLRRLTPARDHSPADDEAEGFTREELCELGERHGLKLVKLEPVWLWSGGLHLGLEAVYRLFRLRRRIRFPATLERAIVRIDQGLLKIPGLRSLAWHYSAFYLKP